MKMCVLCKSLNLIKLYIFIVKEKNIESGFNFLIPDVSEDKKKLLKIFLVDASRLCESNQCDLLCSYADLDIQQN